MSAAAPSRPQPRAARTSVVGRTIVIDGEVSGGGDLVVLGTVRGRVDLDDAVTVQEGGLVEAQVMAKNVTVHGTVKGDIAALRRVEVSVRAHVEGDIRAPDIHIDNGADFKGNVELEG